MALYRTTVTLRTVSGVVEDFPTNTFYFDADNVSDLSDVDSALLVFYNTHIRTRLPSTIAQNGHSITYYRQSDPMPRAPVRTASLNFTGAPTGNTLPSEVALVLSFQAQRASGVNQARRRGRVYIGPLNVGCLDTNGRPITAAVNSLVDAGDALLTASNAATNWTWAVFSRVNGTGTDVNNGWVDNAFDTQRRRGIATSSRTTFE